MSCPSTAPSLKISPWPWAVSVVMGIPSVKREVHSYLTDTLNSLISELTQQEKEDSVIVVLIAEVRQSFACSPCIPGPSALCQTQCQTGWLPTWRPVLLLAGADKPSLGLPSDQDH